MGSGVTEVYGSMTGGGWIDDEITFTHSMIFVLVLLTRESRQGFFCVLLYGICSSYFCQKEIYSHGCKYK